MSKNSIKNTLGRRKIKGQKAQFIGIGLLIVTGVAFFITLFTIALKYNETAKQYFTDQNYASITLYGNFTQSEVKQLEDTKGVTAAKGRQVQDVRDDETIYRTVSLTDNINTPYFYSGENPKDNECLLLKRNADALHKQIGDTITINGKNLKISGLIASPEYVYLVQNERNSMSSAEKLVVTYVNNSFYNLKSFNEIVVTAENEVDIEKLVKDLGFDNYTLQQDQINYQNFEEDLKQIRSFAYIFPGIFALLIVTVIYVMLNRAMVKERKQIGICMALGATDRQIQSIYLSGYALVAVPSALLGGVVAMVLTDQIIGVFQAMFEVPTLQYGFYPVLWVGATLFALLLCTFAGLVTMRKALKMLPAEAMRMRQPKGGKKLLIERVSFLWNRLSFNTRYSVKNSLRNKGRFFAVVLGMCTACALVVFSLGFFNSVKNTTRDFLTTYANYDAIITTEITPTALTHKGESMGSESQRALIVPVKVKENETTVTVVEKGFDMLKIDVPDDGVVIPEHFAKEWGVKEGDELEVEGMTVTVRQIIKQSVGLSIYMKREYAQKVKDDFPKVFNTIFLRADNPQKLRDDLKENGYTFTTLQDDETAFDSMVESMEVLIYVLIACSVLLGGTVLYSVGLITLAAREYEYLFLGVMGYSNKKILLTQIKETIVQLAIALPLGALLGKGLIYLIKGEFSADNYVISVNVLPSSYLIGIGVTLFIVACMTFVTMGYINKLDIVEGLKVQEE